MHRADRPLAGPATFTGFGVFIRHPQAHPRPDSRDQRLAIEAGAYAELERDDTLARDDTSGAIGVTHPTAMPRRQPVVAPTGAEPQ
jgi:hypothetical protein